MGLFCKHQWETISSTFNRPKHILAETAHPENLRDEGVLRLINGFTVVVQKCVNCNKVKHYEILGKADVPVKKSTVMCLYGNHEVEVKDESISDILYCEVCNKDLPEGFVEELNGGSE